MGRKHYNLVREKMPCSIVVDDSRYIYSDYHTTTQHEAALERIRELWELSEDREITILADTDGGCDRIEEVAYSHTLCMENAIFDNGEVVGFYFEFGFYNGYSSRPNAHIFMFDDPSSLFHYNNKSTWRMEPKG